MGGSGIERVGFVMMTSGASGTGLFGFGGMLSAEVLSGTDGVLADPADGSREGIPISSALPRVA